MDTSPVTSTGEVQLRPGETLPCGIRLLADRHDSISLSAQDHLILKRSAAALQRVSGDSTEERYLDSWSWPRLPQREHNLDWETIADFIKPFADHPRTKRLVLGILGLLGLCSAYGPVNLWVGWRFRFPSFPEQLLWGVSCIVIGAVLLLFQIPSYIHNRKTRAQGHWKNTVYHISVLIILVAYLGARIFIVVECFISIRHVPIGVYWTPPWLHMIPHV